MPAPDRIDRAVAWWAVKIGFADKDDHEDIRYYVESLRASSTVGKLLRPATAMAWAVTAGCLSVAVPVAIAALMARYPDDPAWALMDPESAAKKKKRE